MRSVCNGHRRMLFRQSLEAYVGHRTKRLRRKRKKRPGQGESTLMDPELRKLEEELQSSEEETEEEANHRMTFWQVMCPSDGLLDAFFPAWNHFHGSFQISWTASFPGTDSQQTHWCGCTYLVCHQIHRNQTAVRVNKFIAATGPQNSARLA